ncbi:hypothetical protein IQ250_18910 [Pseudanabaenaceae cyanobacterium LEGE 13415]|nr:hypothetical protein [Pseudanabaenaceae cyanobacterium LEGE 13415]
MQDLGGEWGIHRQSFQHLPVVTLPGCFTATTVNEVLSESLNLGKSVRCSVSLAVYDTDGCTGTYTDPTSERHRFHTNKKSPVTNWRGL